MQRPKDQEVKGGGQEEDGDLQFEEKTHLVFILAGREPALLACQNR
jgi:hypothetical protein